VPERAWEFESPLSHRTRRSCTRRVRRDTIRPVSRRETSYAWNDGTALAYQVVETPSSGPDLLLAPGSVTHLEVLWQEPRVERFLTRLAGFSRLILMDPRGLGLSDRLTDVPSLDDRVGDLLAVLDAAGSDRAALFGNADTGPPCIATAVHHPDRVSDLILCGTWARSSWDDDYPFGWTDDDWSEFERYVREDWGKPTSPRDDPSSRHDEAFRSWYATLLRQGASPRAVLLLAEMSRAVDVRPLLARVTIPTLVMHRAGDRVVDVENGRYLADRIPDARWVELAGDDFVLWAGDLDAIADETEEFLTGQRIGPETTRIVATVMFTDVVGSTARAGALGDRAWSDLLRAHDSRLRAQLRRFGGREIDTAGDGFLASFPSPTAAIRCARAVQEAVREIGVEVRIGIHTGECEVADEKLRGVTVHIGARVAATADAGEVVVSQTVKDIATGSGFVFDDAGEHELKGVPDRWHLYRVIDG
jgi:class 3 adenylate cyclase/alpha-beta hydrolase superfamily lysophospholipase